MEGLLTIVLLSSLEPAMADRKPRLTRETAQIGRDPIEVHIYTPRNCERGSGPLLLVFAGYERNAEDYLRRVRRAARAHCMTVFAPEFDRERFPRDLYQLAGVTRQSVKTGNENCMGTVLKQLLDWARAYEGRSDAPYILFGHSAGAQMLTRVAAYCPPLEPARIVLANPSAYVSPSLIEPMPYGLRGYINVKESEDRLRQYLALPITIYLGSEDHGAELLDESAPARRQGRNRFERGQRTYLTALEIAKIRGWGFNWRLVIAQGVGHSSKEMLRAPELPQALGLE